MTASAQLRDLPAARREKVVPRDASSVRPEALVCPLPAPPVPVPPLAPLVRRQQIPPAHRRVPAPAETWVDPPCPPALRSVRVASLVAAATVTLAVVGGLAWVGQTPDSGVPAETVVTRVGAGETLWDVARRVAPRHDQPAVAERIRQLNGIVGSAVQPGQQLQVPNAR